MKLATDDRPQETNQESETGTSENGLGRLAGQRSISINVLRAAGIGIDDGDRHSGWWRIPYPHRTGIHKYRYNNPHPGSRPKYLDDPGSDFHLYNPELLGPGEDEVWFAEGEYDTLALIDAGLKAIGIHGVGNVKKSRDELEKDTDTDEPEEEEGRFRRSWQLLFSDTLVVTMFDNDDDGRKAGRRLARGLNGTAFDGWQGDDYNDVNDWWRNDPAGMAAAIGSFRDRLRDSKGMVPWR